VDLHRLFRPLQSSLEFIDLPSARETSADVDEEGRGFCAQSICGILRWNAAGIAQAGGDFTLLRRITQF